MVRHTQFEKSTIPQVIDLLFIEAKKELRKGFPFSGADKPAAGTRDERRKENIESVALLNTQWLENMGSDQSSPLLEKMSLFWHGHFACRIRKKKTSHNYLKLRNISSICPPF